MAALNNVHVSIILLGYIITQVITAGLIYWSVSRNNTKEIKRLFEERGREHFVSGFNKELRDTLSKAIRESQADILTLIYDHVNKELSATTNVTRELVAERLREIDARIMDVRDSIRKIDDVRVDMQSTNKIVAVMSERLNRFLDEKHK